MKALTISSTIYVAHNNPRAIPGSAGRVANATHLRPLPSQECNPFGRPASPGLSENMMMITNKYADIYSKADISSRPFIRTERYPRECSTCTNPFDTSYNTVELLSSSCEPKKGASGTSIFLGETGDCGRRSTVLLFSGLPPSRRSNGLRNQTVTRLKSYKWQIKIK